LDDLSNPALRTRHWKQLIRLTGGNTLMDSDTFRQLTFGKLFAMSFQGLYWFSFDFLLRILIE
jgi:dynein heavy chain